MKKTIAILTILLFTTSGVTFAQNGNFKFGHINFNTLVSLMSETDSARVKLQAYQNDLQETLTGMQNEYQSKYNTYQQKVNTWTPAVKDTKEKEIQDIVQRIQEFEQNANNEYQQMQNFYMDPIVSKAREAVKKVAKDGGFTYVFDTSSGVLIYLNEVVSVDLLPLTKKELGIPAEKVAPTQIPAKSGASTQSAN
ncbi:MAG: OmpH family outer membrane protein [Bacteroidales bacterium]|jgi:outer membrane protein|nr:OmpH family outer membrane protein [Bacteroidales bacterium]MCI2122202.1 OmpH family outer membrane protein [Bacteroidales bacterium]MCI2145328.1 OmpH family outer membrane protein [Bacteroidales bacterium]